MEQDVIVADAGGGGGNNNPQGQPAQAIGFIAEFNANAQQRYEFETFTKCVDKILMDYKSNKRNG